MDQNTWGGMLEISEILLDTKILLLISTVLVILQLWVSGIRNVPILIYQNQITVQLFIKNNNNTKSQWHVNAQKLQNWNYENKKLHQCNTYILTNDILFNPLYLRTDILFLYLTQLGKLVYCSSWSHGEYPALNKANISMLHSVEI